MKVASTGIVARRAGGVRGLSRRSRLQRQPPSRGGRRRGADLGMQRLQHAGGFLAARHAQVQPLLFLGEQRIGIVLAVVAALAAVLLAHRRHHAAAAAAGLRRASCARRAAWSGRARARRRRLRPQPRSGRRASAPALPAGDSAVASPSSRPAKKPFSQTRCSAVNGAVSGTMAASGGRIGEFMRRPPRTLPSARRSRAGA